MDDTTSRQQIDELADLYLTDPGQGGDNSPPSPVEGPAPIKLVPKISNDAASTINVLQDEPSQPEALLDDSHPVLRLTEDEEELTTATATIETPSDLPDEPTQPSTTDEPAPRAMLEAVLLGNLPGMSGPWLTQYAQLLAQNEGPVILLHVGEEAIDLELIEPRAEAEPAPARPSTTVRIPPMRGDRTGLVGLIDALVQSDQTPARTILVRFDTITDAQTLSRLTAMDDWTLLCGSDDASIAAASQQLRAAVHAEPRLADRNVGVMIMGSDDDAAKQAADRIASALEHDLASPAELIGHLKRMQPVQVRDLGSFPDPVSLWPKLVGFFDSLEMPEVLPEAKTVAEPAAPAPKASAVQATTRIPPKPAAPSAATPATTSRPEPTPRFRQTKPAPIPTPAPKPVTVAATPPPEPPRTQPPAPKRAPRPVVEPMRSAPTPRVLAPQPELDLVALIAQGPAALDGPAPLDARLPDQPKTQLVVDAHGTVHVLAQHLSEQGDARAAVMQLIEAGQWVQDHLELLALTRRDRDFVDIDPVLHLLTDRADLTSQIVGKLAGQIKLHLLQQVQLGKESGWFCTPLG